MSKSSRRTKVYTFILNDRKWTATRLPDDVYNKKHGRDSDAITYDLKCALFFRQSDFKLGYVIHELVHAHSKYFYLNSAKVKREDLEEIYAEFWEENLFRFARMAKQIYRALK
jgi:hypothetical protein